MDTPPTPQPRSPKARWMLASTALTALLAGLAGLAALPVALVAAAYAVLSSEAGTAWLLPRVPGVEVRVVLDGTLLAYCMLPAVMLVYSLGKVYGRWRHG